MTPSAVALSQQRTFLRLWRSLAPHLGTDRDLPLRIQRLLGRRAFGARDRRVYRELLYTALRYRPWIEETAARDEARALAAVAWLAADVPALRSFRAATIPDWPPLPAEMAERARHLEVTGELLPAWFRSHCPAAFVPPNLEALHRRAPFWIRLQTDQPDIVAGEFTARGWTWQPSPVWPEAWNVQAEADLTTAAAYREGRIEIQDLGSQLVLASAPIPSGGRWLDACAGAGGKTLQLARLVGGNGQVDAHDIRAAALAELRRRADRAGLANITVLTDAPRRADYDGVLVDAPCSGSGTWRRAPHLKWSTSPADVAAHAARQLALLDRFGGLVRPGALLVYATCSLSRRENQDVVASFLARRPEFAVVPPARAFAGVVDEFGLTLLPAAHDSDGFFVAPLRRAA